MRRFLILLMASLMLASCYRQNRPTVEDWEMTTAQRDSANFFNTHHYTHDYNFRVKTDSLVLAAVPNPLTISQTSSVAFVTVEAGDRLVVGDFAVIPTDSVDSVWVQVLRDEETIGWIHERELLAGVTPYNPISLFIEFFSNTHLLIFLAFIVVVGALYVFRHYHRHKTKLVHFNDIGSFYPTLLTILVSSSAVLYSTIQVQNPESWSHFFYHPTLNPFQTPVHIGIFLASVWAILIVAVATFTDIRKYITLGEQVVYYLGLMCVCAVDYVIFSVSTLYYIGYPLLLAYIIFAFWRYYRCGRVRYICGNCGKLLREKGKCPYCGAVNV